MADPIGTVNQIFGTIGYSVPDSEVGDYVALLDKARTAFEAVEAMDGLLAPLDALKLP